MAKNTHLTLEDRIIIEVSLKNGESFAEIGRKLEKDPSTISKEVRNHIKIVRNKSYNPCANRASCSKIATVCKSCSAQFLYLCKRCVEYRCYELCTDFVELTCQRLKKPPYICDNCIRRMRCKLERHLYSAKNAQDEYEAMRSESRQGISVSAEELNRKVNLQIHWQSNLIKRIDEELMFFIAIPNVLIKKEVVKLPMK